MKTTWRKFPAYYLVALVLLSAYTPPFHFHPLAIMLAILIGLQIVFRNETTGVVIAVLFILVNLLMGMALISEIHEFTSFDVIAQQLLLGGSALFLFNLLVGIQMILGYAFHEAPKETARDM